MTHEETKARELLLTIYEKRKDEIRVAASWLATEAMLQLDPDRESHPIEYALAHLQLRQLARSILAKRWEKDDSGEIEQHELWPQLQKRYPVARTAPDQEPEYILLENMSLRDGEYNVARLCSEAESKLLHADALKAYLKDRFGETPDAERPAA